MIAEFPIRRTSATGAAGLDRMAAVNAARLTLCWRIGAMNTTLQRNDTRGVVQADRRHDWHHLIRLKPLETIDPRIIVERRGLRVWDANGKEHLDGVSGGVWTVNVGNDRESIANAVCGQLIKLNYFVGAAGSIPGAMFAQRLIEKMPGMRRVYYSNSGSEANEKVFKMMRQISHRHHGGLKSKILYRERDYHGTGRRLGLCGDFLHGDDRGSL
jgi:taurine-pyruvate aminotransferase